MDFELSGEQPLIRSQIRELCTEFGDEYWRERDRRHEYPTEFFETFASGGWCGLTVPVAYGGQGYGIMEAAIIQLEIARSGAGMAGTSLTAHHIFSTEPLVVHGTERHKERYLPLIAAGDVQVCTGVTEPNAGTDTSRIETFAERDGDGYSVTGQKIWTSKAQEADVIMLLARTAPRDPNDRFAGMTLFFTTFDAGMDSVDVAEIPKAGRGASDSNEVWFDGFDIPAGDRIGAEGEGFKYLLEFANAERISIAANAVGIGQVAVQRAADYAAERVVFDAPIGSYQAVQHPLADSWAKLEMDEVMVYKTAWLYDNDEDCGAEANAVKLRASEDSIEACERAVRAHGGMGYAKEYDVERYWRETMINVIAPISNEMAKNYIGQHVLGLPKSY